MRSILFGLCCLISVSLFGNVEDLKRNVTATLPSLEGWCTKEKALHFIDLVLEVKPSVYVEVGVFGGSSLFPVASALKYLGSGQIIGIDPWDKIECIKYFDPIENAEDLKWWGSLKINYIYQSYTNMIKKHKLEDFVKTIRATSEDAAPTIGEIDILYLDGNHSEVCSTQDVHLYLPKVKRGGYIWMNDTLWKEREEAVDLLVEACDAVKVIDNGNCILFKKR
jgi:cephalosporin hydroxylase